MIKKIVLLCIFLIPSIQAYPQRDKILVDLMIKIYNMYFTGSNPVENSIKEIPICIPMPSIFYDNFNTNFIDFKSLKEKIDGNKLYIKDSLHAPLKQELIITSSYGEREEKFHYGVDFRVTEGIDTVYSVFCGIVRIAKNDPTYGNVIVVRHFNMTETLYAHLHTLLVSINQEVQVGDPIGIGGNTGISSASHLHFEIRVNGYPINPIFDNGKFLSQLHTMFK
jgi:murein DD-endopeptidase MepM/ murein hydrolase activator NlpD